MGKLDYLLNRQQKKRKAATEIGLESGLFVICPICQVVTEAAEPSIHRPATESLIRALIRQNDPRLSLFDNDATAVVESVAQVGRDLPYRCNCHSL